MSTPSMIAQKLEELARERNRAVAGEAVMKVVLGLLFTVFPFLIVFAVGCFVGSTLSRSVGVGTVPIGLSIAGLFLIAAIWSAWRNVDPLREVEPLSEAELAHQAVAGAVGLSTFSPRHATAGFAAVLIGGPASVLEGLGLWKSRLPTDAGVLSAAAEMLEMCEDGCPAIRVRRPEAALFLRRLALIKAALDPMGTAFVLTERGLKILAKAKKKAAKRER